MKYTLVAVTCYLVIAGGVGGSYYAYYPYSDGPNAAAEAAGVGLIWSLVVFEFVAEKVTGYYGDVSH